jgi:hypothetical protein
MLSALWDAARGWWAGLSNEQRVYVAVVGVVLLLLAPRILVLTVLLLERLLIGSLLAAEEAALAALVKGGGLVSVHAVWGGSAHCMRQRVVELHCQTGPHIFACMHLTAATVGLS